MQIPGLGQPISLSLSSATTTNVQPTSLLVSVPVTSTVNTIHPGGVQTGGVSGTGQTVVFTNAQTYATLPIGI